MSRIGFKLRPQYGPLACGLLLAALPLLASSEVTVVVKPTASYSQEAIVAMEIEATQIYRPAGVTLRWRLANELAEGENFEDVVVVTLKGSCDARNIEQGNAGRRSGHTLAATHISDKHVLPFATVECESVRQYVQARVSGAPSREGDAIFGRALARVVAHELFHILSGSTHHGQHGVAKAAHSQEDLDQARFELSRADIRFLQDSLQQ